MTAPQINSLATRDTAAVPATVETSAAAVAAQAKASVEARYMVALSRPRDWNQVRSRILAACDRPRFAESARYRKPVGSSHIVGPSIRFAEELMRSLGNIHADSVVVFDDEERRIIRVTVTDLEANVTIPVDAVVEKTVERSSVRQGQQVVSTRTNSQGKTTYRIRTGDDELMVKQNAIVSKALRTGLIRLTPADLLEDAMEHVEATLKKASREAGATDRLVKAFAKLGVGRDHLEGYLGHSMDTLSDEEFDKLRGIGEAIKDGDTTWAEVIAGTPKTSGRGPKPVNGDAYGGATKAKPEVQDMASRPRVPMREGDDPGYGDEDLALDRQLAAEEGA